MSSTGIVRTTSRSGVTRYFVARSSEAPYFCGGNTVDEIRLRLETEHAPGRYRVFDREPAARGIDLELAGVFVVDTGGVARWVPLPVLIAD